MTNGDAANRAGSDISQPAADDKALKLCRFSRPDRDDLFVAEPFECFINPEARNGILADRAADGEDKVAFAAKDTLCLGGEINTPADRAAIASSIASMAICIAVLRSRSLSLKMMATGASLADRLHQVRIST